MTDISIFRTSFIWVETVPAVLAGTLRGAAPHACLGQYGGYAQLFDECQKSGTAAGLRLPWDNPRGNFFWKYYFEGRHAGEMTGARGWKQFVPFQADVDCTTVTANPDMRFTFEALYAPQGIAVIARATCRGKPKSVAEVADLALAARYDYRFAVAGSPGPAEGVSLDQAADRALKVVRQRGFGETEGFSGDNQPFSVTTILVGTDVATVTAGSDEHRLLETVASWNRDLKPAQLAKLPPDRARLPIRAADDDNMMYARPRGRAIWLPRGFADRPDTPTLACYHRNITHAGLLTLSLGEFVSWVAAQHDAGTVIAPALDERAKRAATLLQLLYDGETATGKKVTYRSASVATQIQDAGWAKAMALVKALP